MSLGDQVVFGGCYLTQFPDGRPLRSILIVRTSSVPCMFDVVLFLKHFFFKLCQISDPKKWGFSSDRKKLLVYFYGTKQM